MSAANLNEANSRKGSTTPSTGVQRQPSQKNGSTGAGGGRRTRRKEKKIQIEISLWVNGVKYQYGIMCTFCAKVKAVCHCPLCTDFYCEGCDITAHKTKKRQNHVRTTLSKLDLNAAARLVTFAVRYHGHLLALQARCRQMIQRHFDKKTLNYYYFNKNYGTVSWRKPYCLRKLEIAPFMPPEYAASKVQNLYYLWKAREKARNALLAQYRKIFDRNRGQFYYAYNGKSKLLPKSSWKKPRLLGKRSFPKDLAPIYTIDVAAIIIQRKWRAILMRMFLQAVARASYDEVWDPVKGKYNYLRRDTSVLHPDKPKILRNEPWDPNRVTDWTVERVSLFLRRIGLKQYVEKMRTYEVDGNALILLDDEDYENLVITNRIHRKKIVVEIDKIYKPHKKIVMSEAHQNRREKIRRQKMFHAAAILIQKHFRRHLAQKERKMMKELNRLADVAKMLEKRIEASGIWWSDNVNLPSKKLSELPTMSSTGLKLPPIKSFGKHRDYLSFQGWGRKDTSQGSWLPALAAQMDKKFMGDVHPTHIFTQKLEINGYNEKRLNQFLKEQNSM